MTSRAILPISGEPAICRRTASSRAVNRARSSPAWGLVDAPGCGCSKPVARGSAYCPNAPGGAGMTSSPRLLAPASPRSLGADGTYERTSTRASTSTRVTGCSSLPSRSTRTYHAYHSQLTLERGAFELCFPLIGSTVERKVSPYVRPLRSACHGCIE